ncbi:MAG: lysylphosphatidylglycerol synthase transmembrane domain-containing protein [Candidatus Woesearchaeota archaeon]|nr:lysylphosphatidylglycerol synthase transmembrane domain-containing protein [Candidatus Woesearchaeota archaeon]
MDHTKLIKGALFTSISVLLVWLLFHSINISDLADAFSRVTLIGVALGFVLYALGYLIRAVRFYYLLDKKLGLRVLFFVVCIHNMINSLLPARLGELSYVYLVKKKNIPLAQSTAGLVLTRIFDLIALIILFLVALFMARATLPVFFKNLIPVVWVVLGVLIVGSITLILCEPWLRRFADSRLQILRMLHSFVHSFRREHTCSKIIMLSLSSIVLWISQFLMIYFIFWHMLPVSGWYILIGSLFPILSTVLPVQGIAGFGSIEAAWALAFVMLGLSKEVAIATGFVFHFVIIGYFLVWGFVGWLGWRREQH